MADILHRVGIRADSSRVFQALTSVQGLSGWWTEETSGAAGVGNTIKFNFRNPSGEPIGGFDMEVMQQDPAKRVHWRCKNGPADWIGTEISFDLKQEDGFTIVLFGHRKWREPSESMAHCSTKWGTFMMSLKELVETGQGKPAPGDVKIDNWN
jgi:uncharacterized protein YndB with AHSA1/START domain